MPDPGGLRVPKRGRNARIFLGLERPPGVPIPKFATADIGTGRISESKDTRNY
jgi:hypothetical protein